MRYVVDNWHCIGKKHINLGAPCQDYSFSSIKDDIPYIIVSDGCSGGGRTEFGSMLTVLEANNLLRDNGDLSPSLLRFGLFDAMQSLRLSRGDMLATLLCAYVKENILNFYICGDGNLIIRYMDSSIEILNFEWANETPNYIIYSDDDITAFNRAHGIQEGAKPFKISRFLTNSDSSDGFTVEVEDSYRLDLFIKIPTDNIASVSITSDGFSKIPNSDLVEMLKKATSFQLSGLAGYQKRRMIMMSRELLKCDQISSDDCSIASMILDRS